MDVYLDDGIGAEVEINPDEVEEVKKTKPRKTRLLKKDEKRALLDVLGNLVSNSSEVMSAVTEIISKQNHMHLFKDREQLWTSLQSNRAQSLMTTLVKGLIELFIRVYKSCQKGKEKYCRFQVEWHRQCSLLLTDQVSESEHLSQIHQRWLGYCEGVGAMKKTYNPVMIALYSSVFDYLMKKVAQHKKAEQTPAAVSNEDGQQVPAAVGNDDINDDQSGLALNQLPVQPIDDEEVGVYYRFGGAALASMLHRRYDQLKLISVSDVKKESVKSEIAILKAVQSSDKQQLPHYLQYRDMGYMYFPASCYIPFIRNVDKFVLKYANESSLQQHGPRLVEVVSENLRQRCDLEEQFNSVLKDVYHSYDSHRAIVHEIYKEFTRKLCNTRMQEFIDVHRQLAAKKDSGKSTLSGQNLRDKLLTYHTNSKSD